MNDVRMRALEGLPEIPIGDDIAARLAAHVPPGPGILVVAQKVVSKAEGRIVSLSQIEPSPRALELARELADGPQVAMRLLKRSLYNAAQLTFELACDEIAAKTAISDHHPDAREGVRAFREKRAPRFNRWLEKPET